MRNEKLKNVYPTPPEAFHNAVLTSLRGLDSKSPVRYKNRRIARFAIAAAVMVVLGSVSAVAAATHFFGLFSEPVGQFGLHVGVIEETSGSASEPLKAVKMVFGYMTEGFTRSEYREKDLVKFLNADDADTPRYVFSLEPAEAFDAVVEYVIDSEEIAVNGHRMILTTRQVAEEGETDYSAVMFFEDWGYVVRSLAYNGAEKEELLKILQNLTLAEDTDAAVETLPADMTPSDKVMKRREYKRAVSSSFTMHKLGEAFRWGREEDSNDYTVRVSSIEEKNSAEGIPDEYFSWMSDYSLSYSDFFDENGRLITPYTRHDFSESDGVHTQRREWSTEDDRRFFVITVELTQNTEKPSADFDLFGDLSPVVLLQNSNGSYRSNEQADAYGVMQRVIYGNIDTVCSTPGDDANLLYMSKGETRTLTFGIVVDEDVSDNAYLRFGSTGRETIDDQAETITYRYANDCVKITE